MNDPFVGSLTFIRIYSGSLLKGTYLNSVKDKKEKVGRMLEMHANERKDVDEAFAGDIIALAGMKETTTGDTVCAERFPIILERMEFPDPVIELSGGSQDKADQEKMGIALNRCQPKIHHSAFRPTMNRARRHQGEGELHLDIIVDRTCAANSR